MKRIERNAILIFRHLAVIGCLLFGIMLGIIVTISGLFQSMYERFLTSKLAKGIHEMGRFFQ